MRGRQGRATRSLGRTRGVLLGFVTAIFLGAWLAPAALGADSAYWTAGGAIRVANLDGSGSASNLFTGESVPTGVAIDSAAGKIYWANGADGAIRVANLDGSGSASNLFTGESVPRGVAIDSAAGKIYWSNFDGGAIRVANLDGSGSAQNLFTGESSPHGVAIDSAAGKIYWANTNGGAIRVGNLDGSGSASNLFTGESSPAFVDLLRAPSGTGAPSISGVPKVGQQLSCSEGEWAADLEGAFLYRAPRSFDYQWQKDGSDIPGATNSTYTAAEPGDYSCRVTATNQAGSASQTSATLTVAAAADSVYWSAGGAIRVANLDGSGSASNLFTGESLPRGVAIDPAAGKIYWANLGGGAIRVANLDGSGSPSDLFIGESSPRGVAIDPVAGKIYWANLRSGAIRVATLDGSGSPSDLFTGEGFPEGVAIDPAAGKIYWAASFSGAIRVANLDGTGSAASLFTGESSPVGVAIDPAAGKIYWATGGGAIRVGNLDGSGSAADLFTGEDSPEGVAIDPAGGRIYWVTLGGAIRVGNLDGTGSASDLFSGESSPLFVALVRAPSGTGAPSISGVPKVGQQLSCSEGEWAADLEGAFLYRAPRSFAYQWQKDGADIAGATSSTYTPTSPGDYACRVTASNQAGSASQTSSQRTVVKATPTLSTTASPTTPVGGTIHDTATLSGGSSLTGTITFRLYRPGDTSCSQSPLLKSIRSVSGNGTYTSQSYTPTRIDVYRWRATYSGDANNTAVVTPCGAAGEKVWVPKQTPTISTEARLTPRHAILDFAHLGHGYKPTGSITFNAYGPNDPTCSRPAVYSKRVPVDGNGLYHTLPFKTARPGVYRFTARYNSDARNKGVRSPCNAAGESVRVPPG